MKKFFLLLALIPASAAVHAQGKTNEISVNELPQNVRQVLEGYVSILRNAASLDDAAAQFVKYAGGSLVNEDAHNITLRQDVKPYSLKKDFENIKFYADPLVITRVSSNPDPQAVGFGGSAIKGRVYKIWIAKKDGVEGMPAPVSILVPEGHTVIKEPKVISIGSF